MKRSTLRISLILAALILLLPGCLDIWITTRINTNGSIEKTIVFQGDSSEIAEFPFALLKDDGWKKEWSIPEKDKHKLVVSKEFKSVKEMNSIMNPADTSLLVIRTNSTLNRKFRWFFTRFEYREKILAANPFKAANYKDYITDEEIRLITMDEEVRKADPNFDSVAYKSAEKKFMDFLFRGMFEDFHQELLSIINDDQSLTITKQQLNKQKEEIFRFLVDSVKGSSAEDILDGFNKIIQHPDFETIKINHLKRFDGFKAKVEFFESTSDDNFNFIIRMPGLLLETNSPAIEGSETSWKPDYYDFFFKDFELTASSRVVNTWAFIVAGLIFLFALTGLITTWRKRRMDV
jgi:hypothetical protein